MPSINERLAASGLPTEGVIVCGSGILDALGLREAEDVDVIASKDLFAILQESGRYTCGHLDGDQYCRKGQVEIGGKIVGEPYDGVEVWGTWFGRSYNDVAEDVVAIGGLRYMSVADTIEWKSKKGREKDINDIALLKEYYGIK